MASSELRKLCELFDARLADSDESHSPIASSYSLARPYASVNLSSLLQVCTILQCAPEQLFFNADYDSVGHGCPTCGTETWPVLTFEVKHPQG